MQMRLVSISVEYRVVGHSLYISQGCSVAKHHLLYKRKKPYHERYKLYIPLGLIFKEIPLGLRPVLLACLLTLISDDISYPQAGRSLNLGRGRLTRRMMVTFILLLAACSFSSTNDPSLFLSGSWLSSTTWPPDKRNVHTSG